MEVGNGALTPAADAAPAAYSLDAVATSANHSGAPAPSSVTVVIPPAPPIPPSGQAYLSDLPWLQASNGAWGGRYPPVMRDRSAGDHPITLHGAAYPKGLGMHAFSEVSYYVGGAYATFSADVGVDDDAGVSDAFYGSTDLVAGTVVFQVWADGQKLFDRGVMTRDAPARHVDVPITGREVLTLVVADGGDGTYHDHADWADTRVERS